MERNPNASLITNQQVADQFKQYSDRTVVADDGESYTMGNWEFKFIKLKHGIFRDTNTGVIVSNSGARAIEELKKFDKPLPTIVVMHWAFRNPKNFCKLFSKEFTDAQCLVPERGEFLPI